jgi:type I restriction enzyme S subunit
MLPIKRVARLKAGEGITSLQITEAGDYPVYGGNGFRGYTSNFTHEGKFVLIGRQGALCGNINYAQGRFWASEHAVVVEPLQGHNPIWLGEMLRTINLNQYSLAAAQPSLSVERIENIPIAVPSPPEQTAIGRIIHYIERRVRTYIAAKKKLIALVNEQKQAIIERAVTRGLDPNVSFRPSGIKGLGDVPEDWEIRRSKYFFREVDERSANGAEELLSVSHITGVTPRSQKNITMFMAASNVGHKLCRPGDLAINTMWAWMGALGISGYTGIVSPSYAVYRPLHRSKLLADYADLLLRTRPFVDEYLRRSTGIRSSRLRLYPEQFLRIKLLCPPTEEQHAIVRGVGQTTAATDATIVRAQREIDMLREYRTRLIAEVVTGKLDVREAAARFPEEPAEAPPTEEMEPLDESENAELEAAGEEADA